MRSVSLLLAAIAVLCLITFTPPLALSKGLRASRADAAQATQSTAGAQSKQPEKKDADCGCEAKIPPDVFATVNGVNVATKDIDEALKDQIQQWQNQVIEARKHQLDVEINSRLLDVEAARLGITPEKLLEREVGPKVKQPTDADARLFYDQNKARLQGEFNDLKDQIIAYLRGLSQEAEAKKLADRLRLKAQVKVLVETVTPPETDADRARVLATVNAKPITAADVENSLKPLVFNVQEQVYNLRKQALDQKINELLLEGEAKKRNITAQALFDAEVRPRIKPVTEEDARKFYDDYKSKIQGSYEQMRPQVIQYMQGQAQNKAVEEYADQLKKGGSVQVFLKPPDPPVFNIAIDDRPWRGGANATVTIVEFTDYECPSCGATQPVLEEVVKEFGDKVKLVVRNFPLGQHTHAFKAAEASEAAREQGKYWEYASILFSNQKALEIDKLKEYATRVGLDRAKFDAALESGRFAGKVKRDVADGDKIGVDSTPSVFINGKRTRDRTKEGLRTAIEAALKDGNKKQS
jgi:protein-disulfide isomerase